MTLIYRFVRWWLRRVQATENAGSSWFTLVRSEWVREALCDRAERARALLNRGRKKEEMEVNAGSGPPTAREVLDRELDELLMSVAAAPLGSWSGDPSQRRARLEVAKDLLARIDRASQRVRLNRQHVHSPTWLPQVALGAVALVLIAAIEYLPIDPGASARSSNSGDLAIADRAMARARALNGEASASLERGMLMTSIAYLEMSRGAVSVATDALRQHAADAERHLWGNADATFALLGPLINGAATVDVLTARMRQEHLAADLRIVINAQVAVLPDSVAMAGLAASAPWYSPTVLIVQQSVPRTLLIGGLILLFLICSASLIVTMTSAQELSLKTALEEILKNGSRTSTAIAAAVVAALPIGAVAAGALLENNAPASIHVEHSHVPEDPGGGPRDPGGAGPTGDDPEPTAEPPTATDSVRLVIRPRVVPETGPAAPIIVPVRVRIDTVPFAGPGRLRGGTADSLQLHQAIALLKVIGTRVGVPHAVLDTSGVPRNAASGRP